MDFSLFFKFFFFLGVVYIYSPLPPRSCYICTLIIGEQRTIRGHLMSVPPLTVLYRLSHRIVIICHIYIYSTLFFLYVWMRWKRILDKINNNSIWRVLRKVHMDHLGIFERNQWTIEESQKVYSPSFPFIFECRWEKRKKKLGQTERRKTQGLLFRRSVKLLWG